MNKPEISDALNEWLDKKAQWYCENIFQYFVNNLKREIYRQSSPEIGVKVYEELLSRIMQRIHYEFLKDIEESEYE